MNFPLVPLKRLALGVGRGGTPAYAEGDDRAHLAIGQSCVRPDRTFDVGRARPLTTPLPPKGRLLGGEVLVNATGTGTLGRVTTLRTPPPTGQEWFADTHVAVIRPDPSRADGRFIGYALGVREFERRAHEALAVGSTKQRELDSVRLRNHAVTSPKIALQRMIADFLDRECDRIASLSQHVRQTAASSWQSVVARRRGAIGAVSGDRTRLGRHITCLDGRRVPLNKVERAERSGPYPYWGANSVQDYVDDYLFDEPLVLIGEDGAPFFDPARDVAWTITGKNWVNNHAHVIRPGPELDHGFLASVLNTIDFALHVTGATRDKLTQDDLRQIPIPLADLAEQRRIETDLAHHLRNHARLKAAAERITHRLAEYRDALVTEAVTGELEVASLSETELDERALAAAEGATP